MTSAIEYARAYKADKSLRVLASGVPVHHRGDLLGGGTIEVEMTAPRRNIIRLEYFFLLNVKFLIATD